MHPKSPIPLTCTSVRLTKHDRRRLAALSAIEGLTPSELIRRSIQRELDAAGIPAVAADVSWRSDN